MTKHGRIQNKKKVGRGIFWKLFCRESKKIITSNSTLTFFLIRVTHFFQMIASELSEYKVTLRLKFGSRCGIKANTKTA